ncbi:hypothetical protein L6452_24601 [Arctium lappa]|uniref:Uncharacterized protein n=1 Tax=Arctium lappa TaxID=4217 RepID=A0ACB9A9S3_ARCLA|nr:hypothetical protein L6452_24601 [Arctium lappa]
MGFSFHVPSDWENQRRFLPNPRVFSLSSSSSNRLMIQFLLPPLFYKSDFDDHSSLISRMKGEFARECQQIHPTYTRKTKKKKELPFALTWIT